MRPLVQTRTSAQGCPCTGCQRARQQLAGEFAEEAEALLGTAPLSRRPALDREWPIPQDCPFCQPPSLGSGNGSGPAIPTGQVTALPPTPTFRVSTIYKNAIKHTGSSVSGPSATGTSEPWSLGSQWSPELSCPQSFRNENYFSIPSSP